MFDRYIPRQVSRTNFELFKFKSKSRNRHRPWSPEVRVFEDLPEEPDSALRNTQRRNEILEEVFCKYETKFGENFEPENENKREILHFRKSGPAGSLELPFPGFDVHLFLNPKKQTQVICSQTVKTLNAPGIEDNYYYKSISYASNGHLLVAMQNQIHSFDFQSNESRQLLSIDDAQDISSVAGHPRIPIFSIGSSSGRVQLADQETGQVLRDIYSSDPRTRVVATQFCDRIFAHGTREGQLHIFDIRASRRRVGSFDSHKHEICSIKFSSVNPNLLASGGNDNQVNLYDLRKMKALSTLSFHRAAVRALGFSKNKQDELFSGGGSGDQTLCKWNLNQDGLKAKRDLKSQICSLEVASSDLVITTHGWPNNQVEVRCAKTFELLGQFMGHTQRVLDIAVNEKLGIVATSSGDQSIRFWNFKKFIREKEEILSTSVLHNTNRLR